MEAQSVIHLMVHVGVRPDVISYNTLIDGHCLAGTIDEASKQIDGMVSVGLKLDSFSYDTLLHGYCKDGRIDDAYFLFQKNVEEGTYTWSCDL